MPDVDNNILQNKPGKKSLKNAIIIYADLECLLLKMNTCNNNPRYSLLTSCSFDKSENKQIYYRGKDCMKTFCDDLKEHVTRITNYEMKPMDPLTEEEEESYKNQEKCHICEKEFCTDNNKEMKKATDHCHYTGKYRGAAHSKCNLNYKIVKEIPVLFHNGSVYDYHFIIKYLARKFKSNSEFLGENTDKYISFTVPFKKVINDKEIKHKIRISHSFRFMQDSLSNLVDAALAITGAIKGSSCEKLYQELGLEYLYQRRWARRLCLLYKVFSTGQPSYIYDLLTSMRSSRRHVNSFNTVSCKSEYFKNSFIPNVINEWNKLDTVIRSSTSYNLFRNTLLNFIRPVQRKTFNINDSVGVKLLTRLRLGFSHLREHKFRQSFRDILNPLCPCSIETETTAHYFLRCHFYNANRSSLMDELNEIDISFSTLNENKLIDLILYGSDKFDDKKNYNILMSSIKFIKDSQGFDENLL